MPLDRQNAKRPTSPFGAFLPSWRSCMAGLWFRSHLPTSIPRLLDDLEINEPESEFGGITQDPFFQLILQPMLELLFVETGKR